MKTWFPIASLLSPGPDFVLIVRSAVINGARVASGVCVGIALANGVYIGLAISGVAVQKKVDQGSVLTAEIFDNMLLARQLEGEITLSLIEQYYNQPKEFSITGERQKREYVQINTPDPVTGEILNDITARRANFIIGEQNWKQTLQQAAAESMMELLQQLAPTSPEIVTALLDVAIELFDLPNKTLVLQRIRAVTGMTDPNETPTPEEEAQAAVVGRRGPFRHSPEGLVKRLIL